MARKCKGHVRDRRVDERIIRLKQVGGRSVREIAEMVDVSKSTVDRVLKRTRASAG